MTWYYHLPFMPLLLLSQECYAKSYMLLRILLQSHHYILFFKPLHFWFFLNGKFIFFSPELKQTHAVLEHRRCLTVCPWIVLIMSGCTELTPEHVKQPGKYSWLWFSSYKFFSILLIARTKVNKTKEFLWFMNRQLSLFFFYL